MLHENWAKMEDITRNTFSPDIIGFLVWTFEIAEKPVGKAI